MVKVDARPRWANDSVNALKIGLGYIKYIECGNENDRWWKGNNATQTPEEYAANMSAFYDGHKGTLGKNAGVKTADPAMRVVMGGLATADTSYVRRMINWCKTNRGYLPNGKVNLCFDVINYHWYVNDGDIFSHQRATTGVAPELSGACKVADGFVKIANGMPVWLTETGYDINPKSYQHAPAIGNKTVLQTQADWILRTALMYKRHGIDRLFFYQLFDAEKNGEEQYMTSGLAESPKRRPAADFILQVNKLMGNYRYAGTVSANPLVDRYKLGSKTMYVLVVPDQQSKVTDYKLDMTGHKTSLVHIPQAGSNMMNTSKVSPVDGKLLLKVSETPVFVELVD
ncbi:hypothetical protein FPZ43_02395 [Mucilaginibacter pallidiroseus]|uniref:Asl1-like glycosyl hydrolase catalytic domain-containing protein n=1 Tax=Mucilaginibacter pallidiroseus TaxID=2599295 RepID=A0A563UJ77_9SPHI|nr:hypothetical protein [Mucilaginibacter pallidiroseus]TWR31346.1 hypothetical protein FPZ43_02395 [Mucilaginibacter pallidiroseus]